MKDDNVIELAPHRGRAVAEDAAARSAQRNADRSEEAVAMLEKLRRTPRISRDDRAALARNLGRLLIQMEPETPKLLAKRILQPSSWQKRKRYIRLPNDPVGSSVSYAASGLDFAGIIERLVDEKARRGFDRAQAMTATVYDVLKETSFRQPSRFQIRVGADEEEEAAFLLRAMKQVFDKLAEEVDLAEHFERMSKYPIYPNCPYWWSSNTLELSSKEEPNDIYHWDWLTDEDEFDLQTIPWWAPRCVIGHLYIPLQRRCLHLPEQGVAELRKACGGEVAPETWCDEYSQVLQPFLTSEWIRSRTVYYRLPVLLAALPRPARIVPCLYAATAHPTGFQPEDSFSHDDSIMPRFVVRIGDKIKDDAVFFQDCDDEYNTFYVGVAGPDIFVIGSGIDDHLWDFKPDSCCPSSIDEIPVWLHPYPVQRLLKLTIESETAQHFALSPRNFPGRWFGDCETMFRPNFSDSSTLTQLRQNTIGAYLLRNFADEAGIFEELKSDALKKIMAAKEVIDRELSKFQDAFDKRYGNERPQDHTV